MEQQTQPRIKPNVLINNILHYSMEDTAKLLNMSKKTLQRKMERRLIEYVDFGRDKFFSVASVNEYYERHVVHTKKFMKETRK